MTGEAYHQKIRGQRSIYKEVDQDLKEVVARGRFFKEIREIVDRAVLRGQLVRARSLTDLEQNEVLRKSRNL
jgi:hypothetical protein